MISELLEEQGDVSDGGDVRAAIEARILAAAVGGDQRGRTADLPSIVEAEVARHARENDAVGFLQALTALVAELERVVPPKQPPRHARKIDRNPEPLDGCGDQNGVRSRRKRLAANDGQRALSLRQGSRCRLDPG